MNEKKYFRYISQIQDKPPDAIYTLPFPPSVNGAYRNHSKGRVKTKKYISWIKEAKGALYGQPKVYFEGPVAIVLNLYIPDNRNRDCANYEKVTTDFLVNIGFLRDDSLVRLNIQQWLDWEEKQSKVDVHIYKLNTDGMISRFAKKYWSKVRGKC